jgi:hypothetical protein
MAQRISQTPVIMDGRRVGAMTTHVKRGTSSKKTASDPNRFSAGVWPMEPEREHGESLEDYDKRLERTPKPKDQKEHLRMRERSEQLEDQLRRKDFEAYRREHPFGPGYREDQAHPIDGDRTTTLDQLQKETKPKHKPEYQEHLESGERTRLRPLDQWMSMKGKATAALKQPPIQMIKPETKPPATPSSPAEDSLPHGLREYEPKAEAAKASAKMMQDIRKDDYEKATAQAKAAKEAAAAAAKRKAKDAQDLEDAAAKAEQKRIEAQKAHLDTKDNALFDALAGPVMNRLKHDFPHVFKTKADAAAALASLGVESRGFKDVQEKLSPDKIAKGWRGGLGWSQSTGSRRDEFEDFLKKHALATDSFAGNYGNLHRELSHPYYQKPLVSGRKNVEPLSEAKTLMDKVRVFERAFEKANLDTVDYPRRHGYAERAMKAPSAYDPPAP